MTIFSGFQGYESGNWSNAEEGMWESLTSHANRGMVDEVRYSDEAQFRFHEAYFDTSIWSPTYSELIGDLQDSLKEYLLEFGIDFDEDFDYDAYREWYDSQ